MVSVETSKRSLARWGGSPPLRWGGRINQLAADHSVEALQERVRELTARIAEYEDTYDATSPAAVDAVAVAERSDNQTIDDVYSNLTDWATARQQRERYERARQQQTGSESESVSG